MKMRKSSQMKSDGQRQKRGVKNYVTWNDIADHAPPVEPPLPTSWQFFDIRQETEVKPKIFGRIFGYFVFPASGLNENEKLLCVGVCPSNVKERKTKVESNGQKPWKQNGRQARWMCVCVSESMSVCECVWERQEVQKHQKISFPQKKQNKNYEIKLHVFLSCVRKLNLCIDFFSWYFCIQVIVVFAHLPDIFHLHLWRL